MQTIQIKRDNAIKAMEAASQETKKVLFLLLGEDLEPRSITERVQTFEDVLRIAGKTMNDIVRPGDTVDEVAYKKAKLIAEVFNEGTFLDPMDTDQYKYYPWHKIEPGSGVGLSFFVFGFWRSRSGVGVRLCFKSAALAIDAGNKFLDIYADLKIS